MFCQRCGTALADAGTACPSCLSPVPPPAAPSAGLAAGWKAISRDALASLKVFAGNPVAGLPPAYDSLGERRALRTGIAFGVLSMSCFLLGGYWMLPPFLREDLFDFLGFGGVVKGLAFAGIPFVCTVAGSVGVRKVLGGQGTFAGDCFIAGAALLPISVCMLLAGILSLGNPKTILALVVFAGCIGILMLYSGYTRISKLTERAGSIAVPVVVLLSAWLAKVLSTSVLEGSGPTGLGSGFPY